jgi:hypothetical protein
MRRSHIGPFRAIARSRLTNTILAGGKNLQDRELPRTGETNLDAPGVPPGTTIRCILIRCSLPVKDNPAP